MKRQNSDKNVYLTCSGDGQRQCTDVSTVARHASREGVSDPG